MRLVFVRFLEEIETSKNIFEINWPLDFQKGGKLHNRLMDSFEFNIQLQLQANIGPILFCGSQKRLPFFPVYDKVVASKIFLMNEFS